MKKTVSGVTTSYFYSGSVVISEKQGSAWTDYIFFGNQRIAQQTGSTLTVAKFLHQDHLGSTRVCSDGSGNSAGTCDYEPFGEFQLGSACSSLPTNYRFAGMEFDLETALYHTIFRQYDPNQGRWMSVDALPGSPSDPQSLNRYTYVANDTANLVDSSGLCSLSITYDVHVFWQCYGGPPGAESSRCTIIGGYIEITSANIVGVCGERSGGPGGGGQPGAPKPPGLPGFSQAAYSQCANQAFGSTSGPVPGGPTATIPSYDLALTTFQAGLLVGADLATLGATLALERPTTSLYPPNIAELNGTVSYGPANINSANFNASWVVPDTFGTNLGAGDVFNGDPLANIASGGRRLNRLGNHPENYVGRGRLAQRRARNLANLISIFRDFFNCLSQNLSQNTVPR